MSTTVVGAYFIPFGVPKAHAFAVSVAMLSQGLGFAEKVAGFFGGRSAAKAKALQAKAHTELLKGVNAGLQDITISLQEILQRLDNLPSAVKAILLELRDDQSRVYILAEYQQFLASMDHLLNVPSDGNNLDIIESYEKNLVKWLDRIRSSATRIRNLDRFDRVEPILINCMAVRAELDISNEWAGLGNRDIGLGGSLISYIKYYKALLDPENEKSLKHQLSELEKRRNELLSKTDPSVSKKIHKLIHDPNVENLLSFGKTFTEPNVNGQPPYQSRSVSQYEVVRTLVTADEQVVTLSGDKASCSGMLGDFDAFQPCNKLEGLPKSTSVEYVEIENFEKAQNERLAVAFQISTVKATILACTAALEAATTSLLPINAMRLAQGGMELKID